LIKKNKAIISDRHKNAKFLHVRACNLIVLQNPLYASESKTSEALKARRKIRLDSLKKDVPRSFFKKLLWKISIKKFKYGLL
jgi:hypothetical protein